MESYFYLIIVVSFSLGAAFIWSTKKIQYFGLDTDNEKLVYAAAQSHRWKWPSDMHKLGIGKTETKDVFIILLAIFQKMLRNKTGDFVTVAMGGLSNIASAILIYLIAANYWNDLIGFYVSLLFIVSLWPWQTSLFISHINVATTIFLLSVYLAQQATIIGPPSLWLIMAGFALCLTMFSSGSSGKYLLPFFGAIFYEKYKNILNQNNFKGLGEEILLNNSIIINLWVPVFVLILLTASWLIYKKLTRDAYFNKSFGFLNKMVEGREQFPLEHYLSHARKKMRRGLMLVFKLLLIILILTNVLKFNYMFPIFVGFLTATALLTLPDFVKNIKNYFLRILAISIKYHFRIYIDYFAKKGIKVEKTTRGAGPIWVPKFLFRIIPGHLIFCLALLVWFLILELETLKWPSIALVVFISISPILWGELTRGVQISRSYLPGLVTMGVLFGYLFNQIITINNYTNEIFLIILSIFAWNFWKYLSDVYPARMAIPNLISALHRRGIKEFYTYKTDYNNALVNAIDPEIAKQLIIHHTNSIGELKNKDAWIVIPGTSSKALNMESEMEGINNGDFTKDLLLNKLIETREIENVAEGKFKTFGISRYWVHESEVPSYRDLILHEIKEEDRFRGYAWLIHSSKLRTESRK